MAISLALIVVLGLAADIVFRKFKLPGLVGMLIVGVVVGPHVVGLMRPEMMTVSADFRKIALIVILLRAGFELRRDTLHRVGKTAIIMSALPAILEIAAIMAVAPHFLKLSLLEATILGSILAAVSPAVVVPLMINFMERGKGAKKGIPTMILAASSVDDVFVIVLFTIFLGMYGGQKINIAWQLAGIPISIVLGIIVGLIPGYILYRLFLKYDWQPPRKTLLIIGTSICLMWLEEAAHGVVPVAALLGVMAIGFIILEKEEAIAHLISQKLRPGGHFYRSGGQINRYLPVGIGHRLQLEGEDILRGCLRAQSHSSGRYRRRAAGSRGCRWRGDFSGGGAQHPGDRPPGSHRHYGPRRTHPRRREVDGLSVQNSSREVAAAEGGRKNQKQKTWNDLEDNRRERSLA